MFQKSSRYPGYSTDNHTRVDVNIQHEIAQSAAETYIFKSIRYPDSLTIKYDILRFIYQVKEMES
jgi:hypothetical protein